MASRCKFCERNIKPKHRTARRVIHGCMYTVHLDCSKHHPLTREELEIKSAKNNGRT